MNNILLKISAKILYSIFLQYYTVVEKQLCGNRAWNKKQQFTFLYQIGNLRIINIDEKVKWNSLLYVKQ